MLPALVERGIMDSRQVTLILVLLGLVLLFMSPPLSRLPKPRAYGYQGINAIRNVKIQFDLTNVPNASAAQQLPFPVSPK
jgi:hypothetical protein